MKKNHHGLSDTVDFGAEVSHGIKYIYKFSLKTLSDLGFAILLDIKIHSA